MGEIRGNVRLPGASRCLPVPLGATGPSARFFPLYVFVAALPDVRAHHRERNIPDEITRRTLADVGRGVARHRHSRCRRRRQPVISPPPQLEQKGRPSNG
ncbi:MULTISPECIES: acyltransferase domain-containing protein [unclassified Streptomyces]|uniref:acyltransferase domain-containing protein n=1 Tax=unclassified Streptomyces TaxID=2593676 RepID=UPI00380FB99C